MPTAPDEMAMAGALEGGGLRLRRRWLVRWKADGREGMAMAGGLEGGRLRLRQRWLVGWNADGSS